MSRDFVTADEYRAAARAYWRWSARFKEQGRIDLALEMAQHARDCERDAERLERVSA